MSIDARQLSTLLLDLYECARQPSVQRFQKHTVDSLARYMNFDTAFWGTGTLFAGSTQAHSAYFWNIPNDCIDILNQTAQHNVVALHCAAHPDTATVFPATALYANEATATLARHMGIRQVCAICTLYPSAGLVSFFSVARRLDEPAFGTHECQWLETLMPHLDVMLNLTRLTQMNHIRSAQQPRDTRMAIADIKGIVHVMEPGFESLLTEEWPNWQGPQLPAPLIIDADRPTHRHDGRHLSVEVASVADQWLVTLTRKGPVNRLTPQERATAQVYSSGHSYKEVAQQLGMAPATVRHHLREVYAKLGISDKAALARLLQAGSL